MPWSNQDPDRIVVPSNADIAAGDPAVIVDGTPDPILLASGAEAAIIWNYGISGSRRAFIGYVETDGLTVGEWHILATDFQNPLFKRQFIDLTHNEDGSGDMTLCAQTTPIFMRWNAAGANPAVDISADDVGIGGAVTTTVSGPAIAIGTSITTSLDLRADAITIGDSTRSYPAGSTAGINNAQNVGNDSTTSASYVNTVGTSSFSFTKDFASTRIKLDMHITSQVSVAATGTRFGVSLNGTDYDVCQMVNPQANIRAQASGTTFIGSGLAAGTYTIQGRWKRVSGTGTCQRFVTDDWMSISAMECD
jgi:hypothetical protein